MKKAVSVITSVLIFSGILAGFATAAEPIKIAAIFAKTGIAAEDNLPSLQFVALAVEEINRQGGILGRKVLVIEIDNQSTPLGSKEAALQAVRLNVTAVIGPDWSSHCMAAAPVLQEAGIPMISPLATSPEVTRVGDYIFRVCFTDPFQGKIMAYFAKADLKAKTAVILTNISSDYSIGLAAVFKKTSEEIGLKILGEDNYTEKEIDFSGMLKKVQVRPPDVIFVPGYSRDSAFLIKQARKMGIKSVFLGGDGWGRDMYNYAGNLIEGNYFSSHWHRDVAFPRVKQLKIDFRKKYGTDMRDSMPLPYDAVIILADAMRRSNSLDRKKIRDALASTKNFLGATGSITFDENRDPLNKDAVIIKFDQATTVFVKSFKP
jgi:branched-chain amino acid transport system substrate-binding protein